jgi:hypothetical protein
MQTKYRIFANGLVITSVTKQSAAIYFLSYSNFYCCILCSCMVCYNHVAYNFHSSSSHQLHFQYLATFFNVAKLDGMFRIRLLQHFKPLCSLNQFTNLHAI